MKTTKIMNFKQKNNIVKKYFIEYKKATTFDQIDNYSNYIIKETNSNYLNEKRKYGDFKIIINNFLETLTKEEKQFIENDHLKKDNPNWWCEFYSKSTYYRIKNRIINLFLEFISYE